MTDSHVVVVTGGAGFIGSHTVEHLLEVGCRVVVLDNFQTGSRNNLRAVLDNPNVWVIETNVADDLWPVMMEVERTWGKVHAIVHLAAQTSVVYSMRNPLTDIHNNYVATAQVLEFARCQGPMKVVFSSSSAVYGETTADTISEDLPTQPLSPYGIHKLSSEQLMYCYSEAHGVKTQPLRFFNVFGPRQDPKSPYAGVISLFIKRAVQGEPLTIFGDGEQTRDFVYVKDVATAIVKACLAPGGEGKPVNIGTGSEITINQLAQNIQAMCHSSSEIQHLAPRPGEILRSCANVSRAKEVLDFTVSTPIDEGLRATIDWMLDSP